MATPSASLTRPADPAKAILHARVAEYAAALQDPSGLRVSAEQASSVWGEVKGANPFYSLSGLVPEAQQAYEQGAQGIIRTYAKDPRVGEMLEQWRNHCFATFPAQLFQVDVLTPEDARVVKGTFDRVRAQDPNGVYRYHPNLQPDGSATVEIGTSLAYQSEFYAALAGARRAFIEGEQRAVLNAGQALAQMGEKLVERDQVLSAREQELSQQAVAREQAVAQREQALDEGNRYLEGFKAASPTLAYYDAFPAHVQDRVKRWASVRGHKTPTGKPDVVKYLMTAEGRLKVDSIKTAMDRFDEISEDTQLREAFEKRNERKPWYQTLVADPIKTVQDVSEIVQIKRIMDAEQGLSDIEKRVLDLRLGLKGGTVYEKPVAQVAESLNNVKGQRAHSVRLWSVLGWNREALDFAFDGSNNLLTAEERIYAEAALRKPVWGGYGWRDNFDGQVPVSVANSIIDGYRIAKGAVGQKGERLKPSVSLSGNNYENRWLGRIGVEEEAPTAPAPQVPAPTGQGTQPPAGGTTPITPQATPAQPGRLRKTGRWMKANAKKISGASIAALGALYGSSISEPMNQAMHDVYSSYPTILDADPTVKAIVAGTVMGVGALVYNMGRISNYFERRRARAAQAPPPAAPAVPEAPVAPPTAPPVQPTAPPAAPAQPRRLRRVKAAVPAPPPQGQQQGPPADGTR